MNKTGRTLRFPAWRYGQRLLWHGRDQWGSVEVVKGPLGRGLHFGSSALQGRINLDYPWYPVAEYAFSMSALAALPSPQKRVHDQSLPEVPMVCLLGLGTGSLAWTYHHLIPRAQLTAIELRPSVIEAATAMCGLGDLSSLQIMNGDALERLSELSSRSQTLIAIDLFNAEGMAPCLMAPKFWREVSRVLHPCGAICVNAWSGDQERYHSMLSLITEHFSSAGDLLIIDHEGFGNLVLLVSPRSLNRSGCLERAQKIDERLTAPRLKTKGQRRRWERAAASAGLSGESVHDRLKRAFTNAEH